MQAEQIQNASKNKFVPLGKRCSMNENLKMIDLFAGIGGIRLGFEAHGCESVFSSEWDKYAQKMYEANFGEMPFHLATILYFVSKIKMPITKT